MEYAKIVPKQFQAVIEHLRLHFPDEPLNKCVGLCKTGEPCELLEHHDLSTLQEGLSIMAYVPQTGEIAGVALNGICNKGDNEKALEHMKSIDSVQYRQIFGLLFETNAEIDLFGRYGVDRIFELRILSVNSKFRGQGIAKELFKRSEMVARECGLTLIKTDATSKFSQRVAESLKMEVAKEIFYRDFQDESGDFIYRKIESPHDYYKVMIKQLPKSI